MAENFYSEIMKQAGKMRDNIKKTQDQLEEFTVVGQAGVEPSLVKVKISGRHRALKVGISQAAYKEGREVLCELIAGAINDAAEKIDQGSEKMMSGLMEGIELPKDIASLTEGEPSDDMGFGDEAEPKDK